MRLFLLYISLFIVVTASAQGKYDANWCFGYRCGIDFSDTANPTIFDTRTNNLEATASISDSNGNLQLYIGVDQTINIYNAQNQVILNGDNVVGEFTATNGFMFLPLMSIDSSQIILLQLSQRDAFTQCSSYTCYDLFYSIISTNAAGTFSVTKKTYLFQDIKFMKSWLRLNMQMVKVGGY